jgi:hypothetical protein
MKIVELFFILLIVGKYDPVCAQSKAYSQGSLSAQSYQNKNQDLLKKGDPSIIPGFKGDKLEEASLEGGSIGEKALHLSSTHPASTYMYQHAREKKKITLHEKEEFLIHADEAVDNPEKNMKNIRIIQQKKDGPLKEKLILCEESGEEYTQACSKILHITLKITPEKGHTTPKHCIGHWKSKWRGTKDYCGGCRGGDYVVDEPKKVEVISESWEDGCRVLETHADSGMCRYVSMARGSPETRTIQGEPVYRDHWVEDYTYACHGGLKDNCSALKSKGCRHVTSACIHRVSDVCTRWEQTYACQHTLPRSTSYKAKGKKVPFCLVGDCVDTRYGDNNDMLDALSHLAVLGEAQKDLRAHIGVFKGQVRGCRKNCTNFRDCCTTEKGWGISIGFSECSGEEKELGEWRHQKRCILVGTHCAEKLLGVCVRKITNFCCFGTKLSRLIQEHGRRQLGMNFGTAKCPDCRGFTPEELSRLDFSKIDLSELCEDIQKNFKSPDTTTIKQNIGERIQNNMHSIAQSMKPRSGNMT